MTLHEYLKSKTAPEQKAFAKACDSSLAYLFNVARGDRQASAALCISIERETAGKVSCEEMRSDVDWAYLRNTKPPKKKRAA